MMENAKETLSPILFSKEKKSFQNSMQLRGKKDNTVDRNSVSDKNDLILDRSFNKCCFCTKVFVNSKFLIQHILRRHSEHLDMHQKLNDFNLKDIKGHISQNDVVNVVTNEFSKVKNDLECIKSSLSDCKSNINFSHSSSGKDSNELQVREIFTSVHKKVDILTSELQALKFANVKVENDVSDIKREWNEYGVKNLCNSSNIRDTLIYETLRRDLLLELQNLIAENNNELKLNINQLSLNIKADVERFENLLRVKLEKIDTSTLVQETLKSLENEIELFFSCHQARKFNTHTRELNLSEETIPKVKSHSNHEVVNFCNNEKLLLKKKLTSLNNPINAKKTSFLEHTRKKLQAHDDSEVNITEKIDERLKEVESNSSYEIIDIETELEKKLSTLNIPVGTKRLSNADYNVKMKLMGSEKEELNTKYQSFSDVFLQLNSNLDNNISQKVETEVDKKSRKIRFSLGRKPSCKKSKNKAKDSGVEFAARLSHLQKCSSVEGVNISDDICRKITPINILDSQLMSGDSSYLSNSAASVKPISILNKKRKLPSFPHSHSESKDPSSYESLESDS